MSKCLEFSVLGWYCVRTGPSIGSTVVKFAGIGQKLTVAARAKKVNNLNAVRNASETSFAQVGNDLYVKFYSTPSRYHKIAFRPKP